MTSGARRKVRIEGTHVAGGSAGVLSVVGVPDSSDPEVGEVEVALNVEDEVFGLNVTVDHPVVVDVLKGGDDARHKKAYREG